MKSRAYIYSKRIGLLIQNWVKGLIGVLWVVGFGCVDRVTNEDLLGSVLHAPLSIVVSNTPMSKSRVDGVFMPDQAELGVFLRAADGTLYDGQAFDNVSYKAEGLAMEQKWRMDVNSPIGLSNTRGVAYGYYPRKESGVALDNIPISNDGTDWMYTSSPAVNLYNKKHVAQLSMVHAMTIIRCQIVRGDLAGVGQISSVSVQSTGLAKEASIDLASATLKQFVKVNGEILQEVDANLSAGPLEVDLWAIPTSGSCSITFKTVVDGEPLQVRSQELAIRSGYIHKFTLTVDREAIQLSNVSVEGWSQIADATLGSHFDPSDQAIDWEKAKATDGVYGITSDGKALAYEYAKDKVFAGVAIVVNGKAYQVANQDAKGDDGTNTVYWWKTDAIDIGSLRNRSYVTGSSSHAYLQLTDGSYVGTPHLDPNWYNWIHSGVSVAATSDFDGKGNTDILVEQLGTIEDTIGKAVVNFRNDLELNQGHDDWYAPSLGQLACMGVMAGEIEDVLRKVPGATTFYREDKTDYWSSTESSAAKAWYVGFWDGGVYIAEKYNNRPKRCRMIRDL